MKSLIILEYLKPSMAVLAFEELINRFEVSGDRLESVSGMAKKCILGRGPAHWGGGFYKDRFVVMGLNYTDKNLLLADFRYILKVIK